MFFAQHERIVSCWISFHFVQYSFNLPHPISFFFSSFETNKSLERWNYIWCVEMSPVTDSIGFKRNRTPPFKMIRLLFTQICLKAFFMAMVYALFIRSKAFSHFSSIYLWSFPTFMPLIFYWQLLLSSSVVSANNCQGFFFCVKSPRLTLMTRKKDSSSMVIDIVY